MRIAIISDIHANIEALEAVYAFLDGQSIDRTLCLGDVVGYGPDPSKCLQMIQDRCEIVVAGNHEHAVLGLLDLDYFNPVARHATHWTRDTLSESELKILRSWPLTHVEDSLTLVHGSLDQPDLFDYIQTSWEAHLSFQQLKTPVAFIGHSHVPITFLLTDVVDYSQEDRLQLEPGTQAIVNVGSVGQPRDSNPDASVVIFEPETGQLERYRIPYDIETVQAKILESGLPDFLAHRLADGR